MKLEKIPGTTRTLGESQGYLPLHVRDQAVEDGASGETVNSMTSMWVLTDEERVRIAAGENIYMRVLGVTPPPVMLGVGDWLTYGW